MKKGKQDVKINYNMMVEYFFGSNKITDEKIDIFNKEFNIKFDKNMLYKVPK